MSNSLDRKPTRQSIFSGLFNWSKAHLYLSPANVLAALIALGITIDVIVNCIHVNQLEPGVLAIPFIVCLDILLIALVASLFVKRPSGIIIYLGFVASLIVPKVASIVVIDVLHSLSMRNNFPDETTSRLLKSSINLALSLLYLWDIVSCMREASS